MSSIVSMRLRGEQWARLERYARTPGKSSGETSALLVEERLREAESAFIEFRHSPSGRPIAWARAALSDHEAYRREREEQGISHGGVVFVDKRSVSRQDRGSGTNDRTVAGPWPARHREACYDRRSPPPLGSADRLLLAERSRDVMTPIHAA